MYSMEDGSFTYSAFMRDCPSHQVLETLSGKWTYLIVAALRPGRLRNAALARKIEGISPKMLAQTLRTLERDGLVTRTIYAEVPPRVDYLLTPDGKFKVKMYSRSNLNPVLNNLGTQAAVTTGISLMHTQSFNQVKDLLKSAREKRRKELESAIEQDEAILEEDDQR